MWYNTGIETQRKGHLPMKKPVIHPTAFVAPNATLRGDISLAADSSVFYGAVLRGDTASITIGEGSNIQDNCVVHVDPGLPVTVGKNVTVGHGAILHGCTVGDETLIGMGAIVLNGAKIGSHRHPRRHDGPWLSRPCEVSPDAGGHRLPARDRSALPAGGPGAQRAGKHITPA